MMYTFIFMRGSKTDTAPNDSFVGKLKDCFCKNVVRFSLSVNFFVQSDIFFAKPLSLVGEWVAYWALASLSSLMRSRMASLSRLKAFSNSG